MNTVRNMEDRDLIQQTRFAIVGAAIASLAIYALARAFMGTP